MKQELLDKISALLNSDGINYQVFLQLYETPLAVDNDLQDLVEHLFGADARIEHKAEAEIEAVWTEIESALRYAGYSGAGPGASSLQSPLFAQLFVELESAVRQLAAGSSKIETFQFASEHPAYPVFWDFAFSFRTTDKAVLLVGSSSD